MTLVLLPIFSGLLPIEVAKPSMRAATVYDVPSLPGTCSPLSVPHVHPEDLILIAVAIPLFSVQEEI